MSYAPIGACFFVLGHHINPPRDTFCRHIGCSVFPHHFPICHSIHHHQYQCLTMAWIMPNCTNHHNIGYHWLMNCHGYRSHLTDMSVAYRLWCMIYSMPPHRWNYHSQMTYNPDCCMLNNCYRHQYHLSNTQTCTMYISWPTQSMYNPHHNHQAQCTTVVIKRKKSERLVTTISEGHNVADFRDF